MAITADTPQSEQSRGIPRAITIAGSDSSGGAGIQLDLRIFDRLGIYGMTVVTAVTAQNSTGVQKINKVPPRIVAAQIDSVIKDIGADACKIGMLADATTVETVAARVKRRGIRNVVLDPVIRAKDGTELLSVRGVQRMKRRLIPLALVVMPNAEEAEALSGIPVKTLDDVKEAAKAIRAMGCGWVLVKGGHLPGKPVDVLYDGRRFTELEGPRIEGIPMHGTGCAFSAALAAGIARGDSVPDAARFAKEFVWEMISSAVKLGKGSLLAR